ncbi:MAG: RNA 2',3'-cyclic phosphodiesterase [Ignavibacterium sp.]|nr:RNA 2',3'-cyclic phosphodiesterase [Ignavibacterium sp.]
MKIRTFIALDIPDFVKEKIFNLIYNYSEAKLFRWEPKEKIHLTLKFIGDIEIDIVPEILKSLNFLNEINSQMLILKNFGMFYHKNEPKIFWAGLNVSDELIEIVKKIEDVLFDFGIEKEKRSFKPHLTLLRVKNKRNTDFLEKLKELNFESIDFESDKIIFYQSELLPAGSVYKKIHKFQLKKRSK